MFNLSVERAHHFIANGILVHNCDALAYACQQVNLLRPRGASTGEGYPAKLDEGRDGGFNFGTGHAMPGEQPRGDWPW